MTTTTQTSTYYSGNRYLSLAEMQTNAEYIFNYLGNLGWSKKAICAMLGNMQRESTINPGIWQNLDYGNTSLGYGLVQWTPASNFLDWCNEYGYDESTMDANLLRIKYELDNGLQWITTSECPISFAEFVISDADLTYLTTAFLKNYERAGVAALDERLENAKYWFNYLGEAEGTFIPRLDSEGLTSKIYWSNSNPFTVAGYGLPNCTCYAWGRFWEISDPNGDGSNKPTLPTSDAGLWWNNVTGYSTGQTPKLGAVICWSHNNGGAGHVAIVEQINNDGSFVTSNSAYQSTYFYTKTISSDYSLSGYTFQGFIYNPYAGSSSGGGGGEDDSSVPIFRNQKTQYEYEEETPLVTYYQVKKGDTLSAIAKNHNVTMNAIKRVKFENIVNKNMLSVGEVLLLPKAKPEMTTSNTATTYVVQKGDTLSAIAKKYGTTVASIQKKNHIKNANLIIVGQVLHI